jgi:predicted nucleotidyltransferase
VETILSGVVGSTAYGLAREGSDVDTLGMFVAPTLQVAGLDWTPHRETRHGTSAERDYTEHEIGKAFRLMLSCNPTVLELLWLPEYLTSSTEGAWVSRARSAFLSERAVRASYFGYAKSQAKKLAARGDFGAGMGNRRAKHGRHMLRLLRQGRELLATGTMELRVPDPDSYWAFDDMTVEAMLEVYEREAHAFEETKSSLPAEPDRERVGDILRHIRRTHVE